jgi:hypothetical protein
VKVLLGALEAQSDLLAAHDELVVLDPGAGAGD